jgi:hypothetical protein
MGFQQANGDQAVEMNQLYGLRIADFVHVFSFSANAEGSCVGAEGLTPAQLDEMLPGLAQAIAAVELAS